MRFIDRIGHKYGRLLVIERAANKGKKVMWECKCDCGNYTVVAATSLSQGKTKSCGCLMKEKASEIGKVSNLKHGQNRRRAVSAEYTAWRSMISRCYNPKATSYDIYGGRGVTVCSRWRDSFECFYADMGMKPSPEYSLDRIDPNGIYEPKNCRWATKTEQSRNVRKSRANSTGVKGVQKHSRGKYKSTIVVNSESIFLGTFNSVEEAAKVRKEAEREYWGEVHKG